MCITHKNTLFSLGIKFKPLYLLKYEQMPCNQMPSNDHKRQFSLYTLSGLSSSRETNGKWLIKSTVILIASP